MRNPYVCGDRKKWIFGKKTTNRLLNKDPGFTRIAFFYAFFTRRIMKEPVIIVITSAIIVTPGDRGI